MQTKLTLRMDDGLISVAKARARQQGASLSELVADFFEQLPDPGDEVQLSPWTAGLVGLAKTAGTDAEIRDRRLDELAEKHR